METGKRLLTIFAAAVFLAVLYVPAMAASETADQQMLQEQTRLMAQIQQDTGMSPENVEALRMELRTSTRAAGESGPVRAMVRTAHAEGCQGQCLRETLRLMTKAMDEGLTAGKAQNMLRKEIRNCVRERNETGISESEMCDRLRSRMETQLMKRLRTGQGTAAGSGKGGGMGGKK